ncbi:hypothetical protein Q3V23_13895 [Streptomyces sp. VNUA116]|uniref:hypothetical protein n=1 Tax=Streptomyces sp. VNUA116 TaxID=3062449 RepID=UPI0026768A70|nr:hypothetical protein [Streptomyces sp. VNUA116]WKU45074.1 hypothetical protein Q3V23_13895 [Streptomyces sp. VNUA116]
MSFENEWSELQAGAGSSKPHTRLNGAPSADRGGDIDGPNLASSAARKRAAVSALEQHVEPDTGAAGKLIDEAMEAAGTGFKDWATGAGINDALKGWRASVKSLQNRLSAEKSALRGTNVLLQGADKGLGSEFDRRFPPIAPPPASSGPGPADAKPPFTSRLADY